MPVNPFSDVKGTDWFIDDVIYAYSKGLIEGTTPTTFAPNSNLTYAQAVTLAARMHQLCPSVYENLQNNAAAPILGAGVLTGLFIKYSKHNGFKAADKLNLRQNGYTVAHLYQDYALKHCPQTLLRMILD